MKIQFSTEGAAFKDEYADEETNGIYTAREVIRILERLVGEVATGKTKGSIMDINGNKIGSWEL